MRKKAIMCMAAALFLASSMTTYAAPEVMPDGTLFDAEYYAQIYPDVVAALGTGTDALYLHYVTFGQNEGRLAYYGAQTEEQPKIIGIPGIPGGSYDLPTWGQVEAFDDSNVTDQMITMNVSTEVPDPSQVEYDMERLAPYTTEGYEWRPFFYTVSGTNSEHARWWPYSYWSCTVDNSKDWNYPEEDVAYRNEFTVTWNGVDYTECKLARAMYTGQISEVGIDDGIWLLLPKGYDGKVYLTIKGSILDEYGITANDDAAVTFVY